MYYLLFQSSSSLLHFRTHTEFSATLHEPAKIWRCRHTIPLGSPSRPSLQSVSSSSSSPPHLFSVAPRAKTGLAAALPDTKNLLGRQRSLSASFGSHESSLVDELRHLANWRRRHRHRRHLLPFRRRVGRKALLRLLARLTLRIILWGGVDDEAATRRGVHTSPHAWEGVRCPCSKSGTTC